MNSNLTTTIRRSAVALAAAVVGLTAVSAGTADARVTSVGGASATTVLSCLGDGADVTYLNNNFDYVKLWAYDSQAGWAEGTWQTTVASVGGVGIYVSPGSTYAVYAQFADWTGSGWSIVGEWVANSSRSNYWCRT